MTVADDPYSNEEKWDFVNPAPRSLPKTRERAFKSATCSCSSTRTVYSVGPPRTEPPGSNLGTANNMDPTVYRTAGTQITTSEGHPFRFNASKGKTDLGGDFFTQKRYVDFKIGKRLKLNIPNVPGGYRTESTFNGPILAVNPNNPTLWPGNPVSSSNQLDVLGTQAIARVKPTNPVGGLTTALLELRRDGLPHLFGSTLWEGKTSILRSAGDEYLNKEFGWDPLRQDVSDFLGIVTHANSTIDRYKRGIGKPTRRRYDFPSTETSTNTWLGSAFPYLGVTDVSGNNGKVTWINDGGSAGQLFRESKVTQKRWFSGAFTYYFPAKARGRLGDLAILAHELGLDLSPETIWAATPWSWAIDWFVDAGDVISNYSSFHDDGLVMTYGYMMEHTIVSNTYGLVGATAVNGSVLPVSSVSFVIETKQRRKATPYGFGLSFGGFSNFQKSILGALGLTRAFR